MKEFLSRKGIRFEERDVSTDHRAAMEMVQRTGQQGVPVTVIDGQVVVGFDRSRLEYLLGRAGAAAGPRLGASVADAEAIARRQGGGPLVGAYVGDVKAGSLAARVGLQKGDVIVELGGRSIRNAADVAAAMKAMSPARPATLTYIRGGRKQRVQFVL